MTATDVLRRMLDERGVEWWQKKRHTCWKVGKGQEVEMWRAWEAHDGSLTLKVDYIYDLTPEQAIAATLGATDAKPTQAKSSGTCHITDNGPWGYPYVCSECGASFDPDVNNGEFNFCPNCGRRIVEPTTNVIDTEVEQ